MKDSCLNCTHFMRLPNDGSYKYAELVHGFCDVIKQQFDCPKDFNYENICPHYDVDIMTKGELLKQISDIKTLLERLMNKLDEKGKDDNHKKITD